MGHRIDLAFDAVEIRLTGMTATRLVRGRLAVPYSRISTVSVEARAGLEAGLTGAARAVGSIRRPGQEKVGTFLAGDERQFWAVRASDAATSLVVAQTTLDRFDHIVLLPDRPDAFLETLRGQLRG
jgi:hypothetical protein